MMAQHNSSGVNVQHNGMLISLIQKSKWTVVAEVSGKQVASAKSKPKLFKKLDLLYPPGDSDVVPHPVDKPKRKRSIKFLVLDLIPKGHDDEYIIGVVKENFPKSAFNRKHISWYRSTLHRDGIIGAEFAPRRSQAYKNWRSGNET